MRRTYRSKKDTGGALEHRDVLLNMDEKSSAFDAFYIQNIKQTKRELSCVASSNLAGVPTNRVRKRKYVKRIVKEAQPVHHKEIMSTSAYLTPDKSIRVNKILDPFDMLLNSSPANEENPRSEVEVSVPKKESKTYVRKRRPNIKKFNYSSSTDSSIESDKENSMDTNVTDIRMHDLLVEKEPENPPKKIDDSIQSVLKNLPLLNNIKSKNSSGSFNTSYKNKNKLSRVYLSPALQKSPLCSTPFKEKYRGVSIFKFSPITQKVEQSPVLSDTLEDSNHSIILVSKSIPRKVSHECKESTLAGSRTSIKNISNLANNVNDSASTVAHRVENELVTVNDETQNECTAKITEPEPFLGFSVNEVRKISELRKKILPCSDDSQCSENDMDQDKNKSEITKYKSNNDNDSASTVAHKVENEIETVNDETQNEFTAKMDVSNSFQITEPEPFLGFSANEIEDISELRKKILPCSDDSQCSENDMDQDRNEPEITKSNNVSSNSSQIAFEHTQSEDNLTNITGESLSAEISNVVESCNVTKCSDDSKKDNASSFLQMENDNESQYDTCNSDQSSVTDVTGVEKEPMVVIERMSDSIFFEYYEKMLTSKKDDISQKTDDDDFESVTNGSDEGNSNESLDDDCNETKYKLNPIIITDSSNTDDIVSTEDDVGNKDEYEVEERCISFVTTRRRNDITKDSMFMFDQSCSSNGTDCDKTVLSNNKVSLNKSNNQTTEDVRSNIDSEPSKADSGNDIPLDIRKSIRQNSLLPIESEKCKNMRITRMSTRKSSRISRQSSASTSSKENKTPTSKTRTITRRSSKLPKRSYSISSESENERTMVETTEKEANYKTVVDSKTNVKYNHKLSLQAEISIMNTERLSYIGLEGKAKPGIVLQPGKKWERSLSIYRRITMADQEDHSILEESMQNKGRKYRQSVIMTMEMQESRDSLHNDSINSRRSTFVSNPNRSTIRFVKDPNFSRVSLNTSSVFDDLKGYLSEECDDTVIELSKLSIADSEHEITVLDNFHELERVTTAKDYVLRRCNQTEPILFDECYPETVLKNCHKIGEGVYGEVFLWRARDGRARVMKIVPIAGDVKVNGEAQKDFHEIISEIVIAMELSALRAPIADIERQLDEGRDIHALDLHHVNNATDIFNEVLAVRCVHGPYPSRLLDLWELYDECKGSENDNPAALPPDQRYIVLELANAGQDLESFQFASAQQAHALFQQLAFGLAVGEEAFQFEHRDLHWGNVLIAPTEQKCATFVLRGRTYRVARRGVAATVIDYSLSRVSLPLAGECAALYNDLATDDQLFDAVGDYQFEVYRLMRDKLGNDWKNFEPYTNILWLHYIVDKMITALRYKRTNTKIHKHYIEKLTAIKNSILNYGSAVEFVLNNIEF